MCQRTFCLWCSCFAFSVIVGVGCLIAALTVPALRPLSVNGTVTSTGDCQEGCITYCGYSGNVSVAFTWDDREFNGSIWADTFCGIDCCAGLVQAQTPIYVWINIDATGVPIPYYVSLKTPWAPTLWVNVLIVLSLVCFASAGLGLAGVLSQPRKRDKYTSLN